MSNFTKPRPDIVFMKRRLKPGETPSVRKVEPVSVASDFVDLSLSAPEAPVVTGNNVIVEVSEDIEPVLLAKRQISGKIILTPQEPMVRFNVRQSAIGSLVGKNVEYFAWETYSSSGLVVKQNRGMNLAPVYGNRRLAEFHENDFVLGLRHSQKIRRVFIGNNTEGISFSLFDGSTVHMDTFGGKYVLCISRIGHVLEARMESLEGNDVLTTFSINNSRV
jgi:hypothetical protein